MAAGLRIQADAAKNSQAAKQVSYTGRGHNGLYTLKLGVNKQLSCIGATNSTLNFKVMHQVFVVAL